MTLVRSLTKKYCTNIACRMNRFVRRTSYIWICNSIMSIHICVMILVQCFNEYVYIYTRKHLPLDWIILNIVYPEYCQVQFLYICHAFTFKCNNTSSIPWFRSNVALKHYLHLHHVQSVQTCPVDIILSISHAFNHY